MSPIFVAIDTTDLEEAKSLTDQLRGLVGFKIGMEFFYRHGQEATARIVQDSPMFLDLKLHDIPNTVAGAVRAVLPLRPHFLTVHAAGEGEMIAAAVDASNSVAPPTILGVTRLTSLRADVDEVLRLARMARDAGCGGMVCSTHELRAARRTVGPDFIMMVPGIRPADSAADDQQRVATPADAMAMGADYLVIGRPITRASNPRDATLKIIATLA